VNIKLRIILWVVGAGLLTSLLFSGVVFFEMLEQPYDLLDAQIDHQVDILAAQLRATVAPDHLEVLFRSTPGRWIRFFDAQGSMVWQSALARQVDLPLHRREGGYTVRSNLPVNPVEGLDRYLQDDKGPSDAIAFRVKERDIKAAATTYRIQIALPMAKLDEEIRELIGSLAMGMAASTLLLAVISTFVAGRILKPVKKINRLAREIDEKTLSQRIPLGQSRDELYDLSRSLNHMFDRLQFSFDRQKQFLASASHELKSPISILRLFMEQAVQRQDLPESLRAELAEQQRILMRMNRLVRTLLTLSALELAHTLELETFSLGALVESVLKDYDVAIVSKKLHLDVKLSGPLTIHGDRDKLRQLLVNVVDNAIRYNDEAGEIRIEASGKAGMIALSIFNTGAGVPHEALDKVFDPFYRVEKSRSQRYGGTGLGLSIARQIVRLHQGRIIMESEPGAWTRIRIALPEDADGTGESGRPLPEPTLITGRNGAPAG
jgi:two-component system, OmpR family, sensor kinase